MKPSSRKDTVLIFGGLAVAVITVVLLVIFFFNPTGSRQKKTPINMAASVNAKFTESVLAPGGNNGANNLASFPQGLQHFHGTLFNVQGIIQVTGREMRRAHKDYPDRVNGIKLEAKCRRLHLLHGTGWNESDGRPIAKLILHYADGSERELKIHYGLHVRDWWGPLSEKTTDPGTVLAWTGSNPDAKRNGVPLRIYQSTFENPQPEKQIETIDYATLMANTAPFIIALTVE